MLQHHFFTFSPPVSTANRFNTTLKLNAAHPIFDGHFPGNPIVPGVCMMQMVKEVTQHLTGHSLRLEKAGDMKFLTMLNPDEHQSVNLELIITDAADIKVDARIFKDKKIFFKFKGVFVACY